MRVHFIIGVYSRYHHYLHVIYCTRVNRENLSAAPAIFQGFCVGNFRNILSDMNT